MKTLTAQDRLNEKIQDFKDIGCTQFAKINKTMIVRISSSESPLARHSYLKLYKGTIVGLITRFHPKSTPYFYNTTINIYAPNNDSFHVVSVDVKDVNLIEE